MTFKYLHETSPGCIYLDHRLTPEVRAMLCAMASRAPKGGVRARYLQILKPLVLQQYEIHLDHVGITTEPINLQYHPVDGWSSDSPHTVDWLELQQRAEDRLTTYPLPEKIQVFFDDFVGRFGHSSILELTGSPSVYVEDVSWFTNWMLFDSPQCAGQEFSTRAVQHKDWPVAQEAEGDMDLADLHQRWMSVFEAEVNWWTEHFKDPENRSAYGIADKEPFRPALDRARWALPGTIATGSSHTTSLRERARVLDVGGLLTEHEPANQVWQNIRDCYRQALPGLADMGLKEAVYKTGTNLPYHVATLLSPSVDTDMSMCGITLTEVFPIPDSVAPRLRERTYLDPIFNQAFQVDFNILCSLAVARDWHRHRTAAPWCMEVVVGDDTLQIDPHYEPKSDLGKQLVPALLQRSFEVYSEAMSNQHITRAAMAMPLGTQVNLISSAGLRDFLYMMELRAFAHGANFEYKEQAEECLAQLRDIAEPELVGLIWPDVEGD